MSDLDLPADLIQLQRDLDAARRTIDDYVAAVEAELAALPEADRESLPLGRWSAEQNAKLDELRAAYMDLAKTKWAHPGLGKGSGFEDALREAARAQPAAG